MINLLNGDCLELMKDISDKSVDMVLTDPPYGTTACKWDVVIPFEPMWKELKRITKDNGAICLFGSEPFSSHLRLSNLKMFKYDWIVEKSKPTGHLDTPKMRLMIYRSYMKPYEIEMETDGGPWVSHDYPCPVYSHLNSVYDMDTGIFHPSWVAQKGGYHLIKTDTWFKRLAFNLIFKKEY